jgi:GNAT superfamily N-acetyltransferase
MPTHTDTDIDAPTAVIRPATPADAGAVRRLFAALHAFNAGLEPRFALADGWELELAAHLARERATGDGLTLLAWAGDEPIGLAMVASHLDSPLFRHRRWAELNALYVAPVARGTGLADRLLEAAAVWARARGHAEVRLYVTASNARARAFYAAASFRPVQEIWTAELASAAQTGPWDDAAAEAA